ncbi:MAG: DUF4173 domain-containing protein [Oscillospiraceae bacterium]|nr:DUF4173 domain-containing protein [Oscillospiraceae bacterium]MDD4413380.1 DUF4173 domain-containing protein [Oscillospiraceae bacterium]
MLEQDKNPENLNQSEEPAKASENSNISDYVGGNLNNYYPHPAHTPTPYKRIDQDEIFEHITHRQSFTVVILCWIFGILFADLFLTAGFGLSIPILTALFYAIAFWYLTKKNIIISKQSLVLLIPIALLSLGYFIQDNETTYLINTLLLVCLIPLQLCHMSRTTSGRIFSLQSIYDTIISFVARPIIYLDVPFKAISTNIGKKEKGSKSTMIVLGLVISLPLAAIFISLFIKADEAFGFLANKVYENLNISFGKIYFDLIFGTGTAIFIAAWLITLRARKVPEKTIIKPCKGINEILTATVFIVIDLIFILFVIIQLGYLFAGMELPNGMSYADYARSGFFELCGVLCVSVIVIMICLIFVQKNDKQRLPGYISFLLTVFILCNYVIIASSAYRMITYISAYDLSEKRVMVTWLDAVFAICMIGAIIKIWRPKFNAFSFTALTVIIMSVALNTVNVKALIADYNVDKYLESRTTSSERKVDIEYLGNLGSSAVKATYRLYVNSDYEIKDRALNALKTQERLLSYKTWKNYSLPDIQASSLLKQIKLPDNNQNTDFSVSS